MLQAIPTDTFQISASPLLWAVRIVYPDGSSQVVEAQGDTIYNETEFTLVSVTQDEYNASLIPPTDEII
jgi:hypothetical protein